MDPQFLARLNVLQNYQNQEANQANLEQLQANEEELRKLRQLLSEESNKPQCPHCGGPTEKGFDRCKNCGQEVIWIGHLVGKPSDRAELEMAMEQYELILIQEAKLYPVDKAYKQYTERWDKAMDEKRQRARSSPTSPVNTRTHSDSLRDKAGNNSGCLLIAILVIGIGCAFGFFDR